MGRHRHHRTLRGPVARRVCRLRARRENRPTWCSSASPSSTASWTGARGGSAASSTRRPRKWCTVRYPRRPVGRRSCRWPPYQPPCGGFAAAVVSQSPSSSFHVCDTAGVFTGQV